MIDTESYNKFINFLNEETKEEVDSGKYAELGEFDTAHKICRKITNDVLYKPDDYPEDIKTILQK